MLKINKKFMKKFAAVLALAGFVFSALAQTTLAASPQFNAMSEDYKTLNIANRTSATGWQDYSISANDDDNVAFQVYYHNGIVDSTATNTKIKLSFPTSAQSTISVSTSLWADNASTVTDSVTINSSSSQKLTVDTSSIRWYPNRSTTAQYISASSSGDGYVEVNIGSIQGCWEYQGYVTFTGSLSPEETSNPSLSLEKEVRNYTDSGSFQNSANASPSDELEFLLSVSNDGDTTVSNVEVKDTLPSYLTYISGSTKINGSYTSSDNIISSNGLNIGSLSSGNSAEVKFRASVNNDSYFNNTTRTLTNYGYAWGDSVSEKQDEAYVYVTGNSSGGLYLNKSVLNVSRGETILSDSTNASIGEKVRFSLKATNNSNSYQYNVKIKDTLPSYLTLVSGSIRVDSGSYYDDSSLFSSNGLNIGTFYNGQTKEVTFEVTVNSGASGTLTNYGYAWGDSVSQVYDYAYVYVSGQTTGGLTFEKRVENLSRPNGTTTQNEAYVGETLKYTLVISNNSGSSLNNVKITDVLPSYTSFISADNGGNYSSSTNAVTWSWSSLGNGQVTTVSYQAKIGSVSADRTEIRNTAFLQGDNISSRDSNEVLTTVIVGQVLGAVSAKTGRGGLAQQIMIVSIISLLGLAIAYFYSNQKEQILALANNLKLSWKIWKNR